MWARVLVIGWMLDAHRMIMTQMEMTPLMSSSKEICGSKDHHARDCPDNKNNPKAQGSAANSKDNSDKSTSSDSTLTLTTTSENSGAAPPACAYCLGQGSQTERN